MTFIIGIFRFDCKSDYKQINWNGIKDDISKSDSTLPYLQCGRQFKILLMRELIYTYSLNL